MRKVSAEHNLWGKVLPEVVLMKAIVPEAFIHKGTPASGQKQGEDDAFVVISEYTSPDASMEKLVDEIRKLTKASWQEANVLSYYPITQKDNTSSTILVFEQYPSEDDYQAVTKKRESLRWGSSQPITSASSFSNSSTVQMWQIWRQIPSLPHGLTESVMLVNDIAGE